MSFSVNNLSLSQSLAEWAFVPCCGCLPFIQASNSTIHIQLSEHSQLQMHQRTFLWNSIGSTAFCSLQYVILTQRNSWFTFGWMHLGTKSLRIEGVQRNVVVIVERIAGGDKSHSPQPWTRGQKFVLLPNALGTERNLEWAWKDQAVVVHEGANDECATKGSLHWFRGWCVYPRRLRDDRIETNQMPLGLSEYSNVTLEPGGTGRK